MDQSSILPGPHSVVWTSTNSHIACIPVRTYMYASIYVCIYVYMYTYIHRYEFICIYIYVHIYIYMYRCSRSPFFSFNLSRALSICVSLSLSLSLYICIHAHMHTLRPGHHDALALPSHLCLGSTRVKPCTQNVFQAPTSIQMSTAMRNVGVWQFINTGHMLQKKPSKKVVVSVSAKPCLTCSLEPPDRSAGQGFSLLAFWVAATELKSSCHRSKTLSFLYMAVSKIGWVLFVGVLVIEPGDWGSTLGPLIFENSYMSLSWLHN